MKRIIISVLMAVGLLASLSVASVAVKVYEYDLSEGAEESAEGMLSELIESIPQEIKDELPEGRGTDISEFDFEYFEELIEKSVRSAAVPAFKVVAILLGTVIISAVFNILSKTVCPSSLEGVFSFCSSICVSLSVFSAMKSVFNTVESLLRTLSDTMLIIVPVMEGIYITSGNLTTAAVTSTGINLMISLTQGIFSRVISPLVYAVFILSVVAVVTKNVGITFMSKTLRGMLTGGLLVIMTVMTFVLALQSSGTAAADTFVQRTVKFAIGSYLPIVGGSVADSFSVLSGSLSVIKQSCGIVGIVIIIIAFLPPFAVILLSHLAVGGAGALSSVLGCEREGELLSECKSTCTLLLAVCSGAVVMYIVALGIFCKTPVAIG